MYRVHNCICIGIDLWGQFSDDKGTLNYKIIAFENGGNFHGFLYSAKRLSFLDCILSFLLPEQVKGRQNFRCVLPSFWPAVVCT
jgi:hypothetical protein